MKTIGQTNDGKLLVEMSPKEHDIFRMLARAAQGKVRNGAGDYDMNKGIDADLEGAFVSIATFIDARFAINELRAMVDEMESVLQK